MTYDIDWQKGIVNTPAKPETANPDLSFLQPKPEYSIGPTPAPVPITGMVGSAGQPEAAETPTSTPPPPGETADVTPPGGGYDVKPWEVTPEQLVEDRTANIIDKGSPLMQQAKTRALQEMNKRGLVNSSMAVEAGQGAVMDRAMQIAAADADVYRQAAGTNAAAENLLTGQKLGIESSFGLADMNAKNALISQDLDQQFKTALSNADIASRTQIEAMGNMTRETLANIEANYQTLLGANASAQQMYGTSMQNITDIMSNSQMTPESKNAAVNAQLEMLKTGVGVLDKLNALNLSEVLDFSGIGPMPEAA